MVGICISQTHTDAANRTARLAGSATGPMWSVVPSIRRQSSADSTFMMQRHPVSGDKARSSIMSIATRLGDRRGQWHMGEQAEAGGACSSEHCSCWSHAEQCPSILRGVHPWDPLARPRASIPGGHVAVVRQGRRPMSPALGRDQWQPTGDCRGHRRAPHRSRIYIYRSDFYYFTEVVNLKGGGESARSGRTRERDR